MIQFSQSILSTRKDISLCQTVWSTQPMGVESLSVHNVDYPTGQTGVFRNSEPFPCLISVWQATHLTDTGSQDQAFNLGKGARGNNNRVRMVLIKKELLDVRVHRFVPFFLTCLDMQTR